MITVRSYKVFLEYDTLQNLVNDFCTEMTWSPSCWVHQETTTWRCLRLDRSSTSTTSQVLESWPTIFVYSTETRRCTTSTFAGRVPVSTSTTSTGVVSAPCCTPAQTGNTCTGMRTSKSGGTWESVSENDR